MFEMASIAWCFLISPTNVFENLRAIRTTSSLSNMFGEKGTLQYITTSYVLRKAKKCFPANSTYSRRYYSATGCLFDEKLYLLLLRDVQGTLDGQGEHIFQSS